MIEAIAITLAVLGAALLLILFARIRTAVDVMRGTAFSAPYEDHCRDEHSYGLCRIHTIGAVSAS